MPIEMNNDGQVGEILWIKNKDELLESGVQPDDIQFLRHAGKIVRIFELDSVGSTRRYKVRELLTHEELEPYLCDADIKYRISLMDLIGMVKSNFRMRDPIEDPTYSRSPHLSNLPDMQMKEQPTQIMQEGLPYSETDRETALLHLKLFLHGGGTDCFGEKLMAVIAKADCDNLKRLRRGFPTHVEVWEDYYKGRINSKGETK